MLKFLRRCLAFLLIPCLTGDPALAASFSGSLLISSASPRSNESFNAQALAEKPGTFAGPERGAFSVRFMVMTAAVLLVPIYFRSALPRFGLLEIGRTFRHYYKMAPPAAALEAYSLMAVPILLILVRAFVLRRWINWMALRGSPWRRVLLHMLAEVTALDLQSAPVTQTRMPRPRLSYRRRMALIFLWLTPLIAVPDLVANPPPRAALRSAA
jgi:hypothetical protein